MFPRLKYIDPHELFLGGSLGIRMYPASKAVAMVSSDMHLHTLLLSGEAAGNRGVLFHTQYGVLLLSNVTLCVRIPSTSLGR
jgi:hypothetical protein